MTENNDNYGLNIRFSLNMIPYDSKNSAKEYIINTALDVIDKSQEHDLIQIVLVISRKLKSRIANTDVFMNKILRKLPDDIQINFFIEVLPEDSINGASIDYSDKLVKKYKQMNDDILNTTLESKEDN